MIAEARFSQPNVVRALCLAVYRLHDAPEMSTRMLAEAVTPSFPAVPNAALRVLAALVLRLHFEPVGIADLATAGLDLADMSARRKRPPDTTAAVRARGSRKVLRENITGKATPTSYAGSRSPTELTTSARGLKHLEALPGMAPRPWQIRTTRNGCAILFAHYEVGAP